MTREELRKRISIDPNVCFGKPVIRGTRIWVSLIVDNLADGVSEDEILEAYRRRGRSCRNCRTWDGFCEGGNARAGPGDDTIWMSIRRTAGPPLALPPICRAGTGGRRGRALGWRAARSSTGA